MARAADARLAALVPGQRVPAVRALAAEHLQQGHRVNTICSAAAVLQCLVELETNLLEE